MNEETHRCNSCGRELPLSEFRHRRSKGKEWWEWKCSQCRRAYDTKQKRVRRKVNRKAYNKYMREYMRGYKKT